MTDVKVFLFHTGDVMLRRDAVQCAQYTVCTQIVLNAQIDGLLLDERLARFVLDVQIVVSDDYSSCRTSGIRRRHVTSF